MADSELPTRPKPEEGEPAASGEGTGAPSKNALKKAAKEALRAAESTPAAPTLAPPNGDVSEKKKRKSEAVGDGEKKKKKKRASEAGL